MVAKDKQPQNLEFISFGSIFRMFNKRNILRTILTTLLFIFLGLLYAFFAKPIYTVDTQLKLDITDRQANNNQNNDLIQDLHASNISSLETELDVLQSDLLLSKVLNKVSDNIRYFQVGRVKKTEYYKNTPILLHNVEIFSKNIFAQTFFVTPIDQNHFKIQVKDSIFKKNRYNRGIKGKLFSYGDTVKGIDFSFRVENIRAKAGEKYAFNILYKPQLIKDTRRHLNVRPASADSSVVNISYDDVNPIRAKEFLEYLTQDYIELNIESKSKTTTTILKFLDNQIDNIKDKLKLSSDKLKGYKKENELISIDAKSGEIVDKLVEIGRELEQAKVALKSFSILKHDIDRGNFSSVGAFSNEYDILGTLMVNLETARTDRDLLLSTLTKAHPDVIVANERVQNIIRSIKSVTSGIQANLEQRVRELQRLYDKENLEMKKLPTDEQNLANLERVFRVNEDLYSYLLQRKSELTLLKASKVSDIQVLGEPSIPFKPTKPKKKIIFITSLFLGLLASFILSVLKFHKKIKSVDDLTSKTDIPLYGVIPYVDDEEQYNRAYVLQDSNSMAAEAFRSIRANLEYVTNQEDDENSKVILITSSIPNEGKTVVAANLASVIGLSEKRVIILSLDLRKPELHKKFGIPNDIGMSELLSKKASLKDAVWKHSKYENINIITSGRIPPNPAELLSSKRMAELIRELRSEYDYIILDTPPVNYVSDAMVLFKYSDINLFVVKSDFTDEKYIDGINMLKESLKIRNVGIILNSVKKADNRLEQFDKEYIYYVKKSASKA